MSRGKPVIATDFGGTTDVLDASCGFPVRYTAWRLDRDLGPYAAGTEWARIDEDALARALCQVANLSRDALAAIGANARARVEATLSPAVIGTRMRTLLIEMLAE